MDIVHTGTFHAVGHGLYHSAHVRFWSHGLPDLHYVYDCGSKSEKHVQDCIEQDLKTLGKERRIDLLVLSHLHTDHTSGLDSLLSRAQIKTVILPYLYPFERAIVADMVTAAGLELEEWYLEFLRAPASFLLERGVERVLLIREGEGDGSGPGRSEEPLSPPVDDNRRDASNWQDALDPMDDHMKTEALEDEAAVERKTLSGSSARLAASRGVCKAYFWEFRFFNKETSARKLADLRTTCAALAPPGADLAGLLQDKERLAEITKAYEGVFGTHGMNDTSIALFSGLGGLQHIGTFSATLCMNGAGWNKRYYSDRLLKPSSPPFDRLGLLLTGDLGLGKKTWGAFCAKFRIRASSSRTLVALYQVPHHGSSDNWVEWQAKIPSKPFYVVSAREGDDKHPAGNVLRSLLKNGNSVGLASESNECAYSLVYQW